MISIPNTSLYNVITYDILSEGQPVDPGFELISLEVSKELNRVPTAILVFKDGDSAKESFELSNKEHFIPGKKIEIKMGRDGDNKLLFSGIATNHKIRVRSNGNATLIVECKDQSVKMTVGRHSKYYESKTDSEVIEEIIGKYGLKKDIEPTPSTHAELVQFHASDWDFILSRADVNGKLVTVENGKIIIKAPDTSQAVVTDLHYGINLVRFEAELESASQFKKVEASAWDYKNQELFTAETSSAPIQEPGNVSGEKLAEVIDLEAFELQHGGHVNEQELQAWVDACMLRSRLAAVQGYAHINEGSEEIKPGTIVEIKGVGNRFNGKVFVSSVKHTIEAGSWDMLIGFGLSREWFAAREHIVDYPAAGLLPAVRGLQIGIVRQLQDDPDGEDRILVNFPLIDPNGSGIWVRVASPDAGENRGIYFRPEIGDEVVVGFINDDPRDAIMLGGLHSSAKPSPVPNKDDNHIKGIVTRSEMKFLFDDDKKIVTLETPAGNIFEISEDEKSIKMEDQNGNKIVMDQNGIEISSPKDIVLKATGKIEQTASQDFSIKGLNVKAEANAQLTAKGQASSELSSSGQTTVKGSIVMIN